MMKIKSALLFINILLSCCSMNAQPATKVSNTAKNTLVRNYQIVEVRWDLNINNNLLNQIATKISGSYSPKISVATLQSASKRMTIQYVPELIKWEDILQIMLGEGITDPYIIDQHRKFYLNNDGFMISAITKLL